MISIYLLVLVGLCSRVNSNDITPIVRIYSNVAEFIRPIGKLPLEFSEENWNTIRADSITLLGHNLKVNLQTITEIKQSLNGTRVYISSPVSSEKKTTDKLIKGILVNDQTNLVQIQDSSIVGDDTVYTTVPSDQIYFVEKPTKPKYYVDFKYTSPNSDVAVSYLQSNINWRTQYQLNLNDHQNELIAMANIRNDGKQPLKIERAELIGGDVNLSPQEQDVSSWQLSLKMRATTQYMRLASPQSQEQESSPVVGEASELAGLYVFPINKPFQIEATTNYLLPMFRPQVSVERFGLISKAFRTVSTTGKAERSYRLVSDRFLPAGNAFIREDDRIIGETLLPNIGAKDKYAFSVGDDNDIVYRETITLVSTRVFNETELISNTEHNKGFVPVIINTRTESVYNIALELKNFKHRPIKIEYEQKDLHVFQKVSMTPPKNHYFVQDVSSIKANMTLKANEIENISYSLVIVR